MGEIRDLDILKRNKMYSGGGNHEKVKSARTLLVRLTNESIGVGV